MNYFFRLQYQDLKVLIVDTSPTIINNDISIVIALTDNGNIDLTLPENPVNTIKIKNIGYVGNIVNILNDDVIDNVLQINDFFEFIKTDPQGWFTLTKIKGEVYES